MADSWVLGILMLSEVEEEGGLEKMCWGGPVSVGMIVATARGRIVVRKGICILYGC